MGASGTQMHCYTNQASEYIQPKAPAGGGFGIEVINLKWLYTQYLQHMNIWTRTNEYTDLCRYTGCKITFFRHPYVDFVIAYDRMPPYDLNKFTYPETQPQNMLLRKHKRILLSKYTKPNSKQKLVLKIKPPKQMITKWFFQRDFCEANLLKLSAAAASFSFPGISHGAQSTIFTVTALNTEFYKQSTWCASDKPYWPYDTIKKPVHFIYKEKGTYKVFTIPDNGKATQQDNISYSKGFFSPKALFATKVYTGQGNPQVDPQTGKVLNATTFTEIAALPTVTLRYNPHEDTGHGNQVYLTSCLTGSYNKPTVTPDLNFDGVPLWQAFYGYWDFILQSTKNKGVFDAHMFVVKSDALHTLGTTSSQKYHPIYDTVYGTGSLPWDEYLSQRIKDNWYPTAEWQKIVINNFVCSGPYMPKFQPEDKDTTWQLNYKYEFFFKWGGPHVTDPTIEDPCTRRKYPVPDTVLQTVPVSNPSKLNTESILHAWDFRRGIVTQKALKRMSENLQTDTSFYSDDSETPKKKKKITKELQTTENKQEKIKKCLLSLCEEPTYQEETQDIKLLIQQQQQQQLCLRRNILRLLTHLKKSQRLQSLQTGIID